MSRRIEIPKVVTKKDAEELIKLYPDIFTRKVVDRIIKQNKEKDNG